MPKITFTIPEAIPEQEISQYLMDHIDSYSLAFDRSGDFFDRKSQVNKLEITQVVLAQDQVTIHYAVEYSGFRPCQDLSYSEVANRTVRGLRKGREIRFEVFQEQERRSTCDEL